MIKAVVFDVGGVLETVTDPADGWIGAWENELGLKAGELLERTHELWAGARVGTITEGNVRLGLQRSLEISPTAADRLLESMWTEYLGVLNLELARYVASLRPRYRLGIISNSLVGAREREQQRYGFEDAFDAIVYSHEEGVTKPDPRIYITACERLGVRPEEAIFVDNVEEMVEGARTVGMKGVEFRNTSQAITAIEGSLGSP